MRAGLRIGVGEGSDLALAERADVLVDELGSGAEHDRVHRSDVHHVTHRGRRAAVARDRLAHHRVRDVILAEAAVLLGHRQREEAVLAEELEIAAREEQLVVRALRVRAQLLLAELDQKRTQLLLAVGQEPVGVPLVPEPPERLGAPHLLGHAYLRYAVAGALNRTLGLKPVLRDDARMRALPGGTVTLLFTDIEGSTRLLHELGERYADVLAEHRRLLREAFARHGGVEVDTQGDAFFVAFARASDAVAAARDGQTALEGGRVRVRIGIHTGEPVLTDEGYVGADVHRAARIMGAGHGGQILLSETTRQLLDAEAELRDLGEHRLKDLTAPQRLFQARRR